MTEQQLQAIEQRWAGKKWTAEQSTIKQEGYTVVFGYSTTNREIAEIAAAPTDIALLLAEVKRLQAENISMRNCGNCKKLCVKGPVETELTVLLRMDDCKASGRSLWEAAK